MEVESLFETLDRLRLDSVDCPVELKEKIDAQKFKEYVYYTFPAEKGYRHPDAVELFLWLKGDNEI